MRKYAMKSAVGISSIGVHVPEMYISVEELARLRQVDPAKYVTGLGCNKIALCSSKDDIAELALEAAKRALSRWDGNISDIGLLAVGTESGLDMSRPLSAWIAEKLNLQGNVRSYEVKHACYGGTLATRQAVEWKLAGMGKNKVALIIAADISLYAEGDPGEPTEGAGAIALIIGEPRIAQIDPMSFPYSKPVFDFWRPIGQQFPSVQGGLSLECYIEAVKSCFADLTAGRNLEQVLNQFNAMCFHTPFAKMVKKAFFALCHEHGWDDALIEKIYQQKIDPTMEWNRETGNSYTASLWMAVARALCGLAIGERVAAFSYGSGCGAELLTLQAGPDALQGAWREDILRDLASRREINAEDYKKLRARV